MHDIRIAGSKTTLLGVPTCTLPAGMRLFFGTQHENIDAFRPDPRLWLAFDLPMAAGYAWAQGGDGTHPPHVIEFELMRDVERIIDMPPHPNARTIMGMGDAQHDAAFVIAETTQHRAPERQVLRTAFTEVERKLSEFTGFLDQWTIDSCSLGSARNRELEAALQTLGFAGILLRGQDLEGPAVLINHVDVLRRVRTTTIDEEMGAAIMRDMDEHLDAFDPRPISEGI